MDQNALLLAALMGGSGPQQQLQPQQNPIMSHPIMQALMSGAGAPAPQRTPFSLLPESQQIALLQRQGRRDDGEIDYSRPTIRDLVYDHFAKNPPEPYRPSNQSFSAPFGRPDGRRGSAIRFRF